MSEERVCRQCWSGVNCSQGEGTDRSSVLRSLKSGAADTASIASSVAAANFASPSVPVFARPRLQLAGAIGRGRYGAVYKALLLPQQGRRQESTGCIEVAAKVLLHEAATEDVVAKYLQVCGAQTALFCSWCCCWDSNVVRTPMEAFWVVWLSF